MKTRPHLFSWIVILFVLGVAAGCGSQPDQQTTGDGSSRPRNQKDLESFAVIPKHVPPIPRQEPPINERRGVESPFDSEDPTEEEDAVDDDQMPLRDERPFVDPAYPETPSKKTSRKISRGEASARRYSKRGDNVEPRVPPEIAESGDVVVLVEYRFNRDLGELGENEPWRVHLSLNGWQAAFCSDNHNIGGEAMTLTDAKSKGIELCPRCLWFATSAAPSHGKWAGRDSGVRMIPVTKNFTLDRKTGLLWEQAAGVANATLESAKQRCRELDLDGITDWRLPTEKELDGIAEFLRGRLPGGPGIPPPVDSWDLSVYDGEYWTVDARERSGTKHVRAVSILSVPPQGWAAFVEAIVRRSSEIGGPASDE